MSTTSDYYKRSQAISLAEKDFKTALNISQTIIDPFPKTQSFAIVGRYAPTKKDQLKLITQAFEIAINCPNAYKKVAASTWPLESFAYLGYTKELEHHTSRLLGLLQGEHPVAQGNALYLILGSIRSGPKENYTSQRWRDGRNKERRVQLVHKRQSDEPDLHLSGVYMKVMERFIQICAQVNTWRLDRLCRFLAIMHSKTNPSLSKVLIEHIHQPRIKRLAIRDTNIL